MNSSPRTVLRGHAAAQAVTFSPGTLADLPAVDAAPSTAPTAAEAAGLSPTGPVASVEGEAAQSAGQSSGPLRFDQVYAEQMALLREQAHAEGFDAGHAEGMAVAEQAVAEYVEAARVQMEAEQQAWRTQAQSALTALSAAAAALDARTAPALTEMTDSLAQAAFTLVSDLFDRELATAADPGREAVARALRLVPADEPVVVRLHPTDHAALDPDWVAGLRGTVTLVPDTAVEVAGAIAEAGPRRVDAQLSTALGRVREVLNA